MALRQTCSLVLLLSSLASATFVDRAARADCQMPFRPSVLLHGIRNDGTSWNGGAVKNAVIATGSSPVLQPTTGWTNAIDAQQAIVAGALADNGVFEGTSVGYSLGGLVGRDYMRASYPGSRIKVHMTVGSMHAGAPILDNLQQYRLPAALVLYLMADISLLAWGHLEPNGDGVSINQHNAPYYSLAVATALIALTEKIFVRDAAGAASSNDMKPGSPLLHSLNDNQSYEADVTKVGIVAHEYYPQIYRMAGSATGAGKDNVVGYTHQLEGYCLYQAGGWLWSMLDGSVDWNHGVFAVAVWMSGYATLVEFPKYWNNHLVGSSDNDGVVPAYSQVYPGGFRADVYNTNHLQETGSPDVANIVTAYMNAYSHRYPQPPPPGAPTGLANVGCTNGVVLGWNPVATATSYRVYKDGTLAAEVAGTSYSTLAYESHSYAVQALACAAAGPLSAGLTTACPPPDPPPPGGYAALEWSRDWLTTQGWHSSTFVPPNGPLVMTFQDENGALQMGTRLTECTWGFDLVDSDPGHPMGSSSAVAIGPQDVAGVVYLHQLATNNWEIRYRRGIAYSDGSHGWYAPKILGTTTNYMTPSITFDAAGTAHIAYNDAVGLKYVTVTSALVVSSPVTVSTLAEAGKQSNSIAVDAQGNPSIAFSINTGTYPYGVPALGFATRASGTWTPQSSQTITNAGGFGAKHVLNAAGEPRIACESTTGRLMYVTWANATSSWSFATATDLYIESRLAIALDPSGLARMAVYSRNSSNLDVPTYVRECTTAPRWESSPFDTASTEGIYSPLGLGIQSDGNPIVGYSAVEGNKYAIEVASGAPGTPDVTPPAAVTNVSVVVGHTTAIGSWTASGDDGTTGTAAYYDVRYSSAPIVGESGFAVATPVADPYCPAPSGYGDCASFMGLSPCGRFYFAVKVRDNAGNWSPVSANGYGVLACSGSREVICDPGGGVSAKQADESEAAPTPRALAFTIASPNPARGETRLELAIPADMAGREVRVGVYDAQGRRVRSILQEEARSGTRDLAWDLRAEDGSRVRHGVYFVRMQVGSKSMVRTLIVID